MTAEVVVSPDSIGTSRYPGLVTVAAAKPACVDTTSRVNDVAAATVIAPLVIVTAGTGADDSIRMLPTGTLMPKGSVPGVRPTMPSKTAPLNTPLVLALGNVLDVWSY